MFKINKSMFREYDIRGQVEQDLTPEAIDLIGRGYGAFLAKRGVKKVVVGYDAREYSERIKNTFARALASTGVDVVDVGMVLSPILYFAQYHYKFKGGAMITASHNPNGWSGFKLGYDLATTLLPDDIAEMYQIIASGKFPKGRGQIRKRTGIIDAYTKQVLSRIKLARPMKVVVDAGNGTAGPIAPPILRAAGCQVIERFCDLDYSFPNHEPNPTLVEVLEGLGQAVVKNHADLGVGYDGDGDRLGTVDNLGGSVWADKVIILLARSILKKYPGSKIVFDVKCSDALPEDVLAHGGVPVMWKTGHSYIKQKSNEVDAALGGERSGHIFFRRDYYSYDDAIFASLKLLEYLSREKQTLSEILKTLPQYVSSPTWQVDCADEVKYGVVEKLTKEFKRDYGAKQVIDINGARVKFPNGWGIVRASSNLPVLVLGFEAKTKKQMAEITAIFKKKLLKYPEIGKKWKSG
ncbi:MAG: hypothetical protein A2445_05760 [Candidatus Jacksonbacteria bacterium RIFOXYC2_FULL_44_29]|nr:MAG: hypothetical protein A2240_05605 [Candidatus Jacksonbacteria bacterium RIFOXYA2_FULL_43_12]OGY76782.1 MAG: hypothetical protein A2295_00405 [Candidatus Jacksonbacteria bacterium RIFOXYB2_FULL_44_15]OGY79189.1 MAG: hypothetical protein A2445_05760 [Candidatus Jacksonbacteria bacterium RIFOXYC2_FULL_44_29]OGY82092.1 MAG: hypothetical protein A2550_00120 [Candidatus Jacksonbacteria bacterium RIFOXYD2_FULL_43_21]HBH46891.1 phosphomannomutase/phosphoglucomutase [Candidatus Jacksonbacteria ba